MDSVFVLIGLMLACAVLIQLAHRLGWPSPLVVFVGGCVLGVPEAVPSMPIAPEVMIPLFLPPLLMAAAYYTSWRDFRFNMRPILLLAVGLVLVTAAAVGFTIHWLQPAIPLVVALLIGTIVSPPDAVAASAVLKTMRVPRRVVTVLEGESLLNDATGLVMYQLAVVAVVGGVVAPMQALGSFAQMVAGGVLIGGVIGRASMRLFPALTDRSVQILFTFLVPYLAFAAAESMHCSGVLAVVVAGLVVGWQSPRIFLPDFRPYAEAVWDMVVQVITALIFLLMGLASADLVRAVVQKYPAHELVMLVVSSLIAMMGVRLVWVFVATYLPRLLFASLRRRDPYPAWQNVFVIGWSGMRGVVSLATALAVPATLADGAAFAQRDLVLFTAGCLIFLSLILQGGTLPWLLKRLNLSFDGSLLHEEWQARKQAAEKAMEIIGSLCEGGVAHPPALQRIHSHYRDKLDALGDGPNTPIHGQEQEVSIHPVIEAERAIWVRIIEAERQTVLEMRRRFAMNDDVMHTLLREIDRSYAKFVAHPQG